MTGNWLKHLLLFFLSVSASVGNTDESTTDNSKGYDEIDYEKLGQLGTYWYGDVFRIKDKKTQKIYALKRLGPGKCEHAENEINTLQQLSHRNIVKMIANNLGARSEGDSVHIVLEHMPCNLDAALSYSAT
ncbi:MAG: CMGC/CDK protein kinase, partial [Amphiamblys sp. WSBS2006]